MIKSPYRLPLLCLWLFFSACAQIQVDEASVALPPSEPLQLAIEQQMPEESLEPELKSDPEPEGVFEQVLIEEKRPEKPLIDDARDIDMVSEGDKIYFVAKDLSGQLDDEDLQLELKLSLAGPPELHWVKSSRRYVTEVVTGVAGSVDNYLAGDEVPIENNSYLRIRMGPSFLSAGDASFRADVSLKADLPKTKNDMGIVFDTVPDEFKTLEGQNRASVAGRESGDERQSTAALRFGLDFWQGWRPDLDVGLQTGRGVNPFLRLHVSQLFQLTRNWQLLSSNAAYLYYQQGFAEQSSVQFTRPLSDSLIFISKFEMRWLHEAQSLSFSDIASFTQALNERTAITYRVGGFYEQRPDPHLSSYFIDVRGRYRLYEDWLYAELIPSVTWPQETDFEPVEEITLRFEVFFKS